MYGQWPRVGEGCFVWAMASCRGVGNGQWPRVGEGCFVWAMTSCRGGMFCMGNGYRVVVHGQPSLV